MGAGLAGSDGKRYMSSFTARLQLPGKAKLPLNVEVDIADEKMTVTTEGRVVATWSLSDLEVEAVPDGFFIHIDGEDLILTPDGSADFGHALGIVSSGGTLPGEPAATGQIRPPRFDVPTFAELRYQDLKGKVAEVSKAMMSESVSPDEAFGRWLRLLRELNDRHGHGSLPTHMFCELNGELLDMIPEPSLQMESVTQV